jgi:cation:H+ antiporter
LADSTIWRTERSVSWKRISNFYKASSRTLALTNFHSMVYYLGFFACAAVIFFAGKRLSFYGDQLAEMTGMGKAWIGLILMASVTSLPELMVGISSSAIVRNADLAVGDIMGSCAFNLGILALMDAFVPDRKSIFRTASQSHVLSAALVLTSWIGLTSLLFIVAYLFSIRLVYLSERKKMAVAPPLDNHPAPVLSKGQVIRRYAGFAFLIILTALTLPFFAEEIADQTGLGKSFVGTFFLAVSTSLPEIAVSLAAIRIGSIDLSVGNLLGSNLFNIFILALDDLVYTNGHLLKDASEIHVLSVFSTLIMTAIVIIGLVYPSGGKRFRMAWDSVLIFLVYLFNLFLLFTYSNP